MWLAFLDRITGGDTELQGFLQRLAGYSLTGDTSEQALFFLYGGGANGKGVFLNTLRDYAAAAPLGFLDDGADKRHPTELASLRGARLVVASEVRKGQAWSEIRMKALTGEDDIKARFMRQDEFEFRPQFKLLLAGNHKPRLDGVDEAIRRRMNVIPFSVTIPAAERDGRLPAKLQAEWPGILAWAVQGCLDWQHGGLRRPAAVLAETKAYLAAQDVFSQWLDACCAVGPNERAGSTELFNGWKGWARAANEREGSQREFSEVLQARGFTPKRLSDGPAAISASPSCCLATSLPHRQPATGTARPPQTVRDLRCISRQPPADDGTG